MFSFTKLLLIVTGIGALIIFLKYIYNTMKEELKFFNELKWIPGPATIPIFGNGFEIIQKNPEELFKYINECAKKYGGIFKIWIGNKPLIFIQSEEFIEPILKCPENITKSKEYNYIEPYVGNGLIISTGDLWQRQRKLMTPCFHFEILESFIESMCKNAAICVKNLEKHSIDNSVVQIIHFLKLCALDILINTSMGVTINAQENPKLNYVESIDDMSKIFMKRSFSPFLRYNWIFNWTSYKQLQNKSIQVINDLTEKTIKERRKLLSAIDENTKSNSGKKKRLSLLDLLLKESERNNSISDQMIKNEINNIMFAGHDTTSTSIAFTLFLLGHHPEIQKKIIEESNRAELNFEKGITLNELNKLDYLERCIKESLRIFPVIAIIARQLTKTLKTNHGLLPKNATVLMNLFGLHRNSSIFPKPLEFDPDRFLKNNNDGRNPFSYVPFSAGQRNCIGMKFAIMEIKILLIYILKNYIVKSVDSVELLEKNLSNNIVLHDKNLIKLTIKKRTL